MILELAVDVVPPLDEMSLDSPIERIVLTPLVTQRVKVMSAPLIASSEPRGSLKKNFS
jgi:hypothetical protein